MIKAIKNILIEYKSFFYLYGLFLVLAGLGLLVFSKEESFKFINSMFNPISDSLFKGLTVLGDGLFFAFVALVLALYSYRYAIMGIIIFLSSSLIAQALKLTIFSTSKRPMGYFGSKEGMHTIEGITLHVKYSFPSGHTTTAFALVIFLMMAFKMRKNAWILALIAILVGYSRIYLAVHFLADVYFGSLLGVSSALFIFIWLDDTLKLKFGEKGLMVKK